MASPSNSRFQSMPALCRGSSRSGDPPRLPSELIYDILDELACDLNREKRQQNLASCTLTCHSWLHYASKLLLATVDVDRWDVVSHQWVGLPMLLSYARASPRLQRYVTSVSESLETLCTVPLGEIQRVLPNVRSLTVRGQPQPKYAIPIQPLMTHIETLELTGMRADSLLPSLIHFTSIEHLRLVQPHGYSFGYTPLIFATKRISVQKVSFDDLGLGARDSFLVLQGLLDPNALRSVSVHHRDDACAWYHGDAVLEGLDSFLGSLGQEVRSLSLDVAHIRRGDRTLPALKCCTNLESLTLTMPQTPAISPSALATVCASVVSDVSTSLRRLRLVFTPSTFDDWPAADKPCALTAALSRCSRLKTITFVGTCEGGSVKGARVRMQEMVPEHLVSRLEIVL